jgi:hypothetical protein
MYEIYTLKSHKCFTLNEESIIDVVIEKKYGCAIVPGNNT